MCNTIVYLTFLTNSFRSIPSNWEAVVGTGERCVPGDLCGDGGPASKAKLNYPKGVAISIDKTMYISDGRNIRVVMPDGVIQTLIGAAKGPKGPPRPLPCQEVLLAGKAKTFFLLFDLKEVQACIKSSKIMQNISSGRINIHAPSSSWLHFSRQD